jgi:hypothetical protein
MKTKQLILTCAILIAAYTTLGFGFQNVNDQRATVKTAAASAAAKPSVAKPQAKPETPPVIKATDHEKERISQLIYAVRCKAGRKYADRVAGAIVTSARRNGLPPMMVAATAYIESEFSMTSKPCVGIMQVLLSTARSIFGKSGLDPYDLEDNIELGSRELALYYWKYIRSHFGSRVTLASRGTSEKARDTHSASTRPVLTKEQQMLVMRYTWGRYNGSGMNGGYQRRAIKVLKRLTELTPTEWKKHINSKGPLWKS